jgi:predicted N-acetyltransferase YhbS
MMRKPAFDDYHQIFRLLDRAFAPSGYESILVRNLRDNRKISFDFCIEEHGHVLAYICYTTAYSLERTTGYHLAPVAVLPEKQGQGLGGKIISESLKTLGNSLPVYVLGDLNYYARFGFKKDRTQKCSFDPSGDHFMVISTGSLLPKRDVGYEEEFMR